MISESGMRSFLVVRWEEPVLRGTFYCRCGGRQMVLLGGVAEWQCPDCGAYYELSQYVDLIEM